MTPRENLHRLVDQVADEDVPTIERITEALIMSASKISWDELRRILDSAPIEAEPEDDQERQAITDTREAIARSEVYSDEEVWRRLGHEQAS